ncbi:hypothetical protein MD484_g4266, partial [Candolleomyces efflorescens]
MGDVQNFELPNATHITHNTVLTSSSIDGWKLLQEHTAPNALHNSGARYDAPKCDEDTRVEVIAEVMGIIKDRSHPQRILCMTGAAGAGKSALEQSVSECCEEDGILGCAYFISAADSSRNTASTIVPTIAYQLGLKDPTLRGSIAAAVEHDSLIFTKSLQTQMDILIVRPFECFQSAACDTFPYAILIDGLDECQGDPLNTTDARHPSSTPRYKAEDRQAELLAAIKNSLLKPNLPFRFFIASRPELVVRTALGPGGSLHKVAYHIPLSDEYDATEDMRRYLRRRFQDIGLRINRPDWFTEDNVDTLAEAGSGQFVYVATVCKYVSDPRGLHVERLRAVLEWKPDQVTRPFESLDMLYRHILSNAKEKYEAIDTHKEHNFLLLLNILLTNFDACPDSKCWYYGNANDSPTDYVLDFLGLGQDALETLTLDLRSLVYLGERHQVRALMVYHQSLYDFMDDRSRAQDLYVSNVSMVEHLAKCDMQQILKLKLDEDILKQAGYTECIRRAIYALSEHIQDSDDINVELVHFTDKGGWQRLDMLFSEDWNFRTIGSLEYGLDGGAPYWLRDLSDSGKHFQVRQPKAGQIMMSYIKRWKLWMKERCYEEEREELFSLLGDDTDTSDDDSSDNDTGSSDGDSDSSSPES